MLKETEIRIALVVAAVGILIGGAMASSMTQSRVLKEADRAQFVAVFGVEPQQPMTGTTERLIVLNRLADLRAQKESLHGAWNTNLDFDKLRLAEYEAGRRRLDEAEKLAKQFGAR